MDKCQVIVSTVMNIQVPYDAGNCLTRGEVSDFQKQLC